MAAVDDVPEAVDVPTDCIGRIIGPAGGTIRRLIQGTGCKIEVPRQERGEASNGTVKVQLTGTAAQRKLAFDAIQDVVKGGEAEDHAARASGALVLAHNFERVADEETGEKAPDFDRISWLVWRLIAVEFEHGVKVESGRRTVRVYAKSGKPPLRGEAAEKVRAEIEAIIAQAAGLIKLTVETQLDKDPENASYDQAVLTLTDQYGVLLRVPRPEGGCCPIEVLGPEEPARDAAELIEARYAKGKATACILQNPDQIQALDDTMKEDFAADLQALQEEQRVKITLATSCVWLSGNSADTVEAARQTIVEMLQFYLPEGFLVMKGLKKSAVDKIRDDEELRYLRVQPDCGFSLHPVEGIVWICGSTMREKVQAKIQAILAKWAEEHFELDLDDYGAAMWLLGPRGSGEWLGRMQHESGAKIVVNPNELKVYIDGSPPKLKAAKEAVLKGLDQLRAKQAAEDAAGGRAAPKVKELLSEAPPHMRAILEKLRELENKDAWEKQVARQREWDDWLGRAPRPMQPAPTPLTGVSTAGATVPPPAGEEAGATVPPAASEEGGPSEQRTVDRERSRSRDRPAAA